MIASMIRHMLVAIALIGCGKKDDKPAADKQPAADPSGAGRCPALAVFADGKRLDGLVHGQAVIMENAGYRTPMIQLYNHDKSTCDEILTGRRAPQENEINVRAWHGAMPGVGIDAYTHIGGAIALETPTETVGEVMKICVRGPVVFTPNAGAYSGKQVTIEGLFAASYCGVNKS